MPNYITHAVMGQIVEPPNNEIKLYKPDLRVFSLGQDLLFSCPGALQTTHVLHTRKFFMTLIEKIKNERLQEDSQVMAYLYGHIMHYVLDTKTHPFIYYVTNDVKQKGIVNLHLACEEFLGYFVLKRKLNLQRADISSDFYTKFQISSTSKLRRIIDSLYQEVYRQKNTYQSQLLTTKCIASLGTLTKGMQNNQGEKYLDLLGLRNYLKDNRLELNDLTNSDNQSWYNPITEVKNTSSFLELFDQSVDDSKEIIETVNKVFYKDESLSKLDNIFDDRSYDTGEKCSIGKPFVRSLTLDRKK